MAYTTREAVIRNLKDAGCDRKTIDRFIDCAEKGAVQEQLRLLARYRSTLLDRLHTEQKKIDCLDYLVYQIQKTQAG